MSIIKSATVFLIYALGFSRSYASPSTNCPALAIKAATGIYLLSRAAQHIGTVTWKPNPKNSSNGVSLIVSINSLEYLVALTSENSFDCVKIDYVIGYPYANLMPQ
jgi:hypothetical protein